MEREFDVSRRRGGNSVGLARGYGTGGRYKFPNSALGVFCGVAAVCGGSERFFEAGVRDVKSCSALCQWRA